MESDSRRFLSVAALTFALSVVLGLTSGSFLGRFDLASGFIVLLAVIAIGIAADIVGVAATAAREEPFHAMAADKVPGSREGIWLVRHADRVAIFTLDIVGDVTGTLSGGLAAALALRILAMHPGWGETMLTTLFISLAAALTVGGKAYGKRFAIRRAHDVVFFVARIAHRVQRTFGWEWMSVGNDRARRKRSRMREGTARRPKKS